MNFLLRLIVISCTGTALWLLLIIIRPVTQKLFSQTWHYYTSLIPILFLLGVSNILAPPLSNLIPSSQKDETLPMVSNAYDTVIMTDYLGDIFAGESANPDIKHAKKLSIDTSVKKIQPYVFLIWGIGAVILCCLKAKNYFRFKKDIFANGQALKSDITPLKIVISEISTTPMLIGFWSPCIVLPDMDFSEKELSIILAHELVHYRRKDLYIKLAILITGAIHWFNPLVHIISDDISMLCESSCDEVIVKNMVRDERIFYGKIITSMLEFGAVKRAEFSTGLGMSDKNIKKNKERLINMMSFKKTKLSVAGLSIVLSLTIAGSGSILAAAAADRIPPVSEKTSDLDYKAELLTTDNPFTQTPTIENPITMDEAAAVGAKSISQIYGEDLNGETLVMSYAAVTNVDRTVRMDESEPSVNPLSIFEYDQWQGQVDLDNNIRYVFHVKAETGEMSMIKKYHIDPKTDYQINRHGLNTDEFLFQMSYIDENHPLGQGENEYTDLAVKIMESAFQEKITEGRCTTIWTGYKIISDDFNTSDEKYDGFLTEVYIKSESNQEAILTLTDDMDITIVKFPPTVDREKKINEFLSKM